MYKWKHLKIHGCKSREDTSPATPIISIFARVLTFLHHDAIKIFRRKMQDGQNFLGIDDF